MAPPPNTPLPFSKSLSRSILVTHFVDFKNHVQNQNGGDWDHGSTTNEKSADGSPSWAIERFLPWPVEGGSHDDFIDSKVAQNLLCLEIASGSSVHRKAEIEKRGNVHILFPGSLRVRGEFAIVDLAVAIDDTKTRRRRGESSGETPSQQRINETTAEQNNEAGEEGETDQIMWKVTNVDFHSIQFPS